MTAVRPPRLSVLVASAVTLILIGRSGGPLAAGQGAVRSAARAAFAPVEAAGDAAFRPLEAVADGVGREGDLSEAERAVARERGRAASEAARAEALAAENGRLAALLHLEGPSAGEGVAARIVSRGGGSGDGPVLIDRGGDAGIRAGMPVVAAGGLVGRILEVGPGHSTVLVLAGRASAVGVRVGEAGVAAVAQGVGAPSLRLDLLDPEAPLDAGALAVTSGLRHSRFPAGLPVGRVTGSRGRWSVKPFAAPGRTELVKVLRWEPAG